MPGLVDRGGVCGEEFQFSLSRCALCHRPFCSSCSMRIGGSAFCGKECGHAFFYGAGEEVEDSEAAEREEEEE